MLMAMVIVTDKEKLVEVIEKEVEGKRMPWWVRSVFNRGRCTRKIERAVFSPYEDT